MQDIFSSVFFMNLGIVCQEYRERPPPIKVGHFSTGSLRFLWIVATFLITISFQSILRAW